MRGSSLSLVTTMAELPENLRALPGCLDPQCGKLCRHIGDLLTDPGKDIATDRAEACDLTAKHGHKFTLRPTRQLVFCAGPHNPHPKCHEGCHG